MQTAPPKAASFTHKVDATPVGSGRYFVQACVQGPGWPPAAPAHRLQRRQGRDRLADERAAPARRRAESERGGLVDVAEGKVGVAAGGRGAGVVLDASAGRQA